MEDLYHKSRYWRNISDVLWFLIHVTNIWMYVISPVYKAGWLGIRPSVHPSCIAKTVRLDIMRKLFNHNFHPCHTYRHRWLLSFAPLSVTLTLAEDHKISAKENLLVWFSRTLFNWSGRNLICCWSDSSWTSWYYCWVRFMERREMMAVLPMTYN